MEMSNVTTGGGFNSYDRMKDQGSKIPGMPPVATPSMFMNALAYCVTSVLPCTQRKSLSDRETKAASVTKSLLNPAQQQSQLLSAYQEVLTADEPEAKASGVCGAVGRLVDPDGGYFSLMKKAIEIQGVMPERAEDILQKIHQSRDMTKGITSVAKSDAEAEIIAAQVLKAIMVLSLEMNVLSGTPGDFRFQMDRAAYTVIREQSQSRDDAKDVLIHEDMLHELMSTLLGNKDYRRQLADEVRMTIGESVSRLGKGNGRSASVVKEHLNDYLEGLAELHKYRLEEAGRFTDIPDKSLSNADALVCMGFDQPSVITSAMVSTFLDEGFDPKDGDKKARPQVFHAAVSKACPILADLISGPSIEGKKGKKQRYVDYSTSRALYLSALHDPGENGEQDVDRARDTLFRVAKKLDLNAIIAQLLTIAGGGNSDDADEQSYVQQAQSLLMNIIAEQKVGSEILVKSDGKFVVNGDLNRSVANDGERDDQLPAMRNLTVLGHSLKGPSHLEVLYRALLMASEKSFATIPADATQAQKKEIQQGNLMIQTAVQTVHMLDFVVSFAGHRAYQKISNGLKTVEAAAETMEVTAETEAAEESAEGEKETTELQSLDTLKTNADMVTRLDQLHKVRVDMRSPEELSQIAVLTKRIREMKTAGKNSPDDVYADLTAAPKAPARKAGKTTATEKAPETEVVTPRGRRGRGKPSATKAVVTPVLKGRGRKQRKAEQAAPAVVVAPVRARGGNKKAQTVQSEAVTVDTSAEKAAERRIKELERENKQLEELLKKMTGSSKDAQLSPVRRRGRRSAVSVSADQSAVSATTVATPDKGADEARPARIRKLSPKGEEQQGKMAAEEGKRKRRSPLR